MLIAALLLATVQQAVPAERQVMLTGFDRVRIDGAYAVTIVTGAPSGARIAGDPRARDRVRLRVDGTTLTITGVRSDPGPLPTIALSTGRIAALAVRGGGQVRVDRMVAARVDLSLTGDGGIDVAATDAAELQVTLVGAGALRIAGRAARARFAVNGSTAVDAAALVSDELTLVSAGTGGGRYHARYAADVGATGTGPVVVTGNPQCRTRGNAPVRCGP